MTDKMYKDIRERLHNPERLVMSQIRGLLHKIEIKRIDLLLWGLGESYLAFVSLSLQCRMEADVSANLAEGQFCEREEMVNWLTQIFDFSGDEVSSWNALQLKGNFASVSKTASLSLKRLSKSAADSPTLNADLHVAKIEFLSYQAAKALPGIKGYDLTCIWSFEFDSYAGLSHKNVLGLSPLGVKALTTEAGLIKSRIAGDDSPSKQEHLLRPLCNVQQHCALRICLE